ncbi:MAG: ArnT family glycosyltransferase [Anaerolineae bacterium]
MVKRFLRLRRRWLTFGNLILAGVILVGAALRFYGLAWDAPYFFHPDEGRVIQVTMKLESAPNPEFSIYGLLPMYLLHSVRLALAPLLPPTRFNLFIMGRVLSASFGSLSIFICYLAARRAYSRKTGLLAASLLAFSVLHIRKSHFYSVDVTFTFLSLVALVLILTLTGKRETLRYLKAGLACGLVLAVKVGAFALPVPMIVAHLSGGGQVPATSQSGGHLRRLGDWRLWLAMACMVGVFIALNPFSILDLENYFLHHGLLWNLFMAQGYFRPQYTLQYEGTTPYIYYLANVLFWGLGPFLEVAAILGIMYALVRWRKAENAVLVSFALAYFLTTGSWRVKFSRYALPLVPVMALLAANFLLEWRSLPFLSRLPAWLEKVGVVLVVVPSFLYSLAFMQIYARPDTRIEASRWIYENVPSGATILLENDKDAYAPPIKGERYHLARLNFDYLYRHSSFGAKSYLPEFLRGLNITRKKGEVTDEGGELLSNEEKWQYINGRLAQADYIVFSERNYDLYRRLPELFPVEYEYYRKLFAGELDFELIQVFKRRPGLFGLEIDDSQAELTSRIFDHPTIWIFRRRETP